MKKLFLLLALIFALSANVSATTVTVSAHSLTTLPFQPTNIGSDRTFTVTATNGSATVTSSAAFPTNIVGIGGFQILIGSTQYVIASVQSVSSLTLTTNFSGITGSATMTLYKYVLLRSYATAGFQDNVTGQNVQPGTPGSGNFYKQVAVSVINSGSGNVAYMPEFTIPSTTNALINNQARYVFGFYRTDGSLLSFYLCGSISQLAIQPTTPTTWTAICNFNSPGGVVPPNTSVYTAAQIDQRLPNCSTDQLYFFAASGNILSCISLGTNLSIAGSVLNAAGGGGGGNINPGTTGQIGYYAGVGTTISPATVGSQLTLTGATLKTSGVRPAINAVVDYGVVCDGATNTLVALQNAVSAAALSGGGDVVLPAGNCRITGTLTVPGGVTLEGQGALKTIISSVTNAVIVDAVEGTGSYAFFGPSIRNLQILGSVSAGSSQVGLKMDDNAFYFNSDIRNVHIYNTGDNGLYIGNVYSSRWENIFISNCADYPFLYNSSGLPSNSFVNIYVGDLRASAPTGFRIKRGDFTCTGCNMVNNIVAASRAVAVGTKNGVDGDSSNAGGNFDCLNCNFETWVGYGIYAYANSLINLRGTTTFAMDVSGSTTGIPIYFENNGDGVDYFAQYVRRGVVEDSVIFANTITDYANSQPIQAAGFPPLETAGYGPAISSGTLTTYRNTTTSANVQLSRKDSQSGIQSVTTSTSFVQPGIRYIEANCAAACTITLPWTGYYRVGQEITIKDISGAAATFNVSINANSGSTVNGSSFTLAKNGQAVTLFPSNAGNDWRVLGTSVATGTITGSLVSGRVTLSTGTSTVGDDADLLFDGQNLTSGRYYTTTGAVGAPSYSILSDNETGFYSVADGKFGFASNGAESVRFQSNGLMLRDGRITWDTSETIFDLTGSGTPEGAVTAAIGSLFRRTNGGASTTLYVKTSGAGNTGWTALGAGTGTITGSGSTGTLPKFTAASAIGDSILAESSGVLTTTGTQVISGKTINTDATGTVASLTSAATFTKNDVNSRTFDVVRIKPVFNFGGANTSTTVNLLAIDSTNTAVTGTIFNLINAQYGGATKWSVDSAGAITFASGVRQAFAPSTTVASLNFGQVASDPSSPVNGDCVYNTGSNKFRCYENSAWTNMVGGTGTVTSVGFTGGLISVATATTTPALTVAGTSGGIPYFSSATTWASSAALAASAIVVGGGAGTTPASVSGATLSSGAVLALAPTARTSGSPAAPFTQFRDAADTGLSTQEQISHQVGGDGSQTTITRTMGASGGTVTTWRNEVHVAPTLAASAATTITNAYGTTFDSIIAGSNITLTTSTAVRIKPSVTTHHGLFADGQVAHTGDPVRIGLAGSAVVRFNAAGGTINSVFNDNGALSSGATDGFPYISRLDSATNPTGTPTSYNGSSPILLQNNTANTQYVLKGYLNSGWRDLSQSLGETSPAQITADQNNYNPGAVTMLQRWNTDASRQVTGLTFTPTQMAGQMHTICNVGSTDIVLVHSSASSTAANRFATTTALNITIVGQQCAQAVYDGTTARWRAWLLP